MQIVKTSSGKRKDRNPVAAANWLGLASGLPLLLYSTIFAVSLAFAQPVEYPETASEFPTPRSLTVYVAQILGDENIPVERAEVKVKQKCIEPEREKSEETGSNGSASFAELICEEITLQVLKVQFKPSVKVIALPATDDRVTIIIEMEPLPLPPGAAAGEDD